YEPSNDLTSTSSSQDPSTLVVSALSLHDALPICQDALVFQRLGHVAVRDAVRDTFRDRGLTDTRFADQHGVVLRASAEHLHHAPDRKSTRLNSSHVKISYAVFCLKKKNISEKPQS